MTRRAIYTITLTCLLGAAAGEDKDLVSAKLDEAKRAYDKEIAAYLRAAGEWFDTREDAARKAGDKKAVDAIKAERKAFDEGGELPKAAPAALRQRAAAARKALEGAYAQAVKEYVKAKMDDHAAAVEKQLEEFRKSAGPSWTAAFPPGTYAASYDGGVKATIELRRDGTFTRTRDGKSYPGTVSAAEGKLILKCEEFVETWAVVNGRIRVEHWWPANTFPKGKPQSAGTAVRSKE